jgi:hypothetical protein
MMGILVPETCWGNKAAYFVASSWFFTFTIPLSVYDWLDAFAKLRKATLGFVMSIRLSVRPEQFGSHWKGFSDISYLSASYNSKICEVSSSNITIGAVLFTYSMEQSPSRETNQYAASQEIYRIFMEPEGSLPYSQVPATCPYPEPTPSTH